MNNFTFPKKTSCVFVTLLCAMVLSLPVRMVGQTELTVYDESASNAYVPFIGSIDSRWQKTEYVIPASELTAMNGKVIAMLKYRHSYPYYVDRYSHYKVFLKEVGFTSFGDNPSYQGYEGATVVYEGQLFPRENYLLVEFDNLYTYHGGNLLIGFYTTQTGGSYSYQYSYYGKTVEGASISGLADAMDDVPATQRDFVPKTTFTYYDEDFCFEPSTLSYDENSLTPTSVELDWTPRGNETTWGFEYSTDYGDTWSDLGVTADHHPFTLNNLQPGTEYYVSVYAKCGDEDFSEGSTSVFFATPLCNPENKCEITYRLYDMYNDGWDGDAHISVMHSDREVASLWLEYGESGVLRSLNLCDGETYFFVWVCGSCDNECSFEFYGSDGNLIQGMNYSEGEVPQGEYGEEYPLLSNYVMQCPTCRKPRNLSVVTTPSSASITWTADSSHNSWELQYSTDETNWSATQTVTGNPTGTINSLDPATEYFARVRANCGDGDFSAWSTISFFTDCGTITVDASHPYFENFDAIRGWGFYDEAWGHILPRCWDALNNSASEYDMYYPALFGEHPYYDNMEGGGEYKDSDECVTSYSCPTYLRFRAYDASEQYAILPAMSNVNGLQLKFMASMADVIGFDDTEFHVGVMTDPTDASTYTEIKSFVFAFPGYEELTVYFNEYELQPDVDEYYIAMKLVVPDGGNGEVYVDDVSVSVLPSCLAPYELTVSNVQENDATLTWSPNGNETAWQVRYSADKTNWTTVDFTEAEPGGTVTKLLDNLSHNTLYYVQVRANCGDSYSDWSRTSKFRTNCSSTYQDVPYYEDFDSYIDFEERLPQCWDYINTSHSEQYPTNQSYPLIANGVEGYFANSYMYFLISYYDYLNYHYGMDPQDQYVIMPRMEDIGNLQLKFLGMGERNNYWTDYNCQVKIGVFDDNGTFHLIRTVETSRTGYYKNYYVSFEGYEGAGRITFLVETPEQFGSRCYSSLVKIDNVSVTPKVSYKKFIADGNWDDASCWENGEMPASDSDDVLISAAAVIPSGCSAVCGIIEYDGNDASITIEDGGALKHNNSGVAATVKKHIEPYTEGERDQWNLITAPFVDEVYFYDVNNINSGDYDLYYYDQSYDSVEWRNQENYMTSWYYLTPMKGYLYANSEEVTLEFNGELFPSNADQSVPLDYVEGVSKTGWNLIGNPFVCPAYLANNMAYYRMNAAGTALESALAGMAINPAEGVFVRATGSGQTAVFTTTSQDSKSRLDIRLSRNQGPASDNAIIGFGEGSTLVKVMLNSNASKIYFTEDRVDYSIIRGGQLGEEMLYFKAAEDGAYTLYFSFEDIDMTYLHLIDNKTGIETDLLQTPSYSFDACKTDLESRFKLVFVSH